MSCVSTDAGEEERLEGSAIPGFVEFVSGEPRYGAGNIDARLAIWRLIIRSQENQDKTLINNLANAAESG
jgi:hypothetical protein